MEDKRVTKTKRNLKNTLIALLGKTSFEKITVSELCRVAQTGRITFYTHYEDKYALVDEMLDDYLCEADADYHNLEAHKNPMHDERSGYLNLLECILNLYGNNTDFFAHATSKENPYLYSAFYRKTFSSVASYITRHTNGFCSKYPPQQTAALLCNGLWGVINECCTSAAPHEQIYESIRRMYCDILDSSIFIKTQ